ncbi:NYN domain-containing protein [Chlorogloea sp. CCALA 695]|uniref:NYN domain-containing protein n=1 Tax=Chlorogloea sp. CCALA 695 TaxID=2107693 RepID=UPI000D04E43D|nr:NYN domain-containing protein [Chlorogloea sp. CCALA 695]PSB29007.1 NYN domain-containing protein [Chlorogloea sp. CCALA 695]
MQNNTQLKSDRLAVLIDADNATASIIEALLKEIAKYGTAHVKRVYGDWTSTHLNSWKDKLNRFAIQPIQQFSYTSGKNSTDSALIIDAMDLLYTNNFNGFCIVSSDSDFTRLACRIRESGLIVYGFGEKKTPEPFQKACDKFTYTENLEETEDQGGSEVVKAKKDTQNNNLKSSSELKENFKLVKLVKNAYEAIAEEDGWASLGELGGQINKLSSSFDSRTYGYKKLGELIRAIDMFEIKTIPHEKNTAAKVLYIKLKN